MAVDFGILAQTPSIGARYMEGMQMRQADAERNMLRQQQVMQFQQAQQDRAFQLEERKKQAERNAQFEGVAKLIREQGMDPDDPKVLGQFAEAALKAQNPQLVSFVGQMAERAAKRREAAAVQKRIQTAMGGVEGPPAPEPAANALAPAPAVSPAVNAMLAPPPAQREMLAGTPFAIGMAPPPAAAPAPAAPAVTDNARKIAELERRRDALELGGTAQELALAKQVQRQIEKLAPPKPETFAPPELVRLQDRLAQLPEGDPRRPAIEQRIGVLTKPQQGTKVEVKLAGEGSKTAVNAIAQDLVKERRTLANSEETITNLNAARKLVPNAKAFMGTGGEPLMAVASFLNNRLGFDINVKGVTDATELRTRLFDQILNNLKKLDSQPSQEQQRVMQEALGNLGTDPNALPRILDKIEESVRMRVNMFNEDVDAMSAEGVKFLRPIKLPERARPAAKDTPAARTVVRTGTLNGRRVVQYSDGSTEYAAD